jgi:EAL domain-containing protein (putative c-di-GMP-specific phosphodiesterase class I)
MTTITTNQRDDHSVGEVLSELDDHPDATRLHAELVELIRRGSVRLDLEPIRHIGTGSCVGAEALARFPETRTTAEWFRVAHVLGLGNDLEMRVVDEVLQRSAGAGSSLTGVNVSPQAIMDPRLFDMLHRFDSERLVIEITDQTSTPELGMLRTRLAELRSLGIRIAVHVDDFSPESFRSLLVAEPDFVKLSPGLTHALAAGVVPMTQTENFFARCRRDGVFIVSVGIENDEQLRALERCGVDAYQGFINRTVTVDPIIGW